ncbi:hypothetical protein SAMN05660748_2322 [Blastococcus aggregatus]|uniref:Polyketide cyclase / dehydrase and lipid transport n=1 Tax=Blastococcus aggregatus TaxID=38502 RepID=A0A285V639_9ACTN|nr:hypothetical protein SAMN05660748_2322 [Blastococcus aggregatus]
MRRIGTAAADVVVGGALVLGAVVASPVLRRRYNRWGVDEEEVTADLPGDELVAAPDLGYTRGITVDAPVDVVWPWVAQMGQGRGGFYSYDGLENLCRCDIHSADHVLPEHQDVAVGDVVRLAPGRAPSFRVHAVRPPVALVLVSAGPDAPDEQARAGAGTPVVTWQWILRPSGGGRRTRLLVRQRLSRPPAQRLMWRLVEPVGFVMERRMLRGIKARAEGRAPGGQVAGGQVS